MNIIRLGIIGLGAMGEVLFPSILNIPSIKVEAICDSYPERVER